MKSRETLTMSWLFGVGKDQNPPQVPQNPFLPPMPPPGDGGDDQNKGGQGQGGDNKGSSRSETYSFDSAALERAASAAKELEKSSKYSITYRVSQIIAFGDCREKLSVFERDPYGP